MTLIEFTKKGLYCAPGDFFIDPWRPVDYAIITHAHSDHSRWGMKRYLAHHHSVPVMQLRLGENIVVQGVEYNEPVYRNGVKITLHPAGHIIGSAQVRVEYQGEVWVISGDYKTEPDASCVGFEPVICHHFITESTFGLPVFNWEPQQQILNGIEQFWQNCAANNKVAVLFCYSLGKAQRIINQINNSGGPLFTHGAVENTNEALRQANIEVSSTIRVTRELKKSDFKGGLVIAPPSAMGTPWMKNFGPYSTAIASGWMALRGARRRRNADRGFVLSDHADWQGLNTAIAATQAENIYVTHGYTSLFTQWLNEQGYNARVVETEFEGELHDIGESKIVETTES